MRRFRHAVGRVFAISVLVLTFCSLGVGGEKFVHRSLGFEISLPEGVKRYPSLRRVTPDTLTAFIVGDPNDDQLDIVILVDRLRGTIGRKRFKKSMLPPDFQGRLLSESWRGFELDVFEVPERVQGFEFLNYNVQVPLKREAVQLRFIGPAERKDELRSLLRRTLAGLQGESNWSVSAPSSPPAKSFVSPKTYGILLLIGGILVLLLGLVLLWLISRKSPRGMVLALAVLIYAAAMAISDTRVRELKVFGGFLKMLGFGGVILGMIDFLRKRD